MATPSPTNLIAAFPYLSGADPISSRQMVFAARVVVPHADYVNFTINDRRMRLRDSANTGPVASQVDVIQRQLGEGPSLDSVSCADSVHVDELSVDDHWPRFAKVACAVTTVRSLLAIRTPLADKCSAVLCFYADGPAEFTTEDEVAGRVIATLVANTYDRLAAQAKAEHLKVALASATTIGTALGILIARDGVTSDEAFDRLRVASQHLHRKLHDLAEEVTVTGELPAFH
ncbi:MAG TPA: ANTAR domain-containing protein [Jatrophihabitans sp.]|jgi:hypothetical protein